MISSSKTRQQVATEYDQTRKTFGRRLKSDNLDFGRKLLTPDQLLTIYGKYGIPPKLPKEEREYYEKKLLRN